MVFPSGGGGQPESHRESTVKTSLRLQTSEKGLGERPSHPRNERSRFLGEVTYDKTIFAIRPDTYGAANDLRIMTEDRLTLYYVRTKALSLEMRSYTVYDDAGTEHMTTRPEPSALFACHTVIHNDTPVASVGQQGIMPLQYFIECPQRPRMHLRMQALQSTFELKEAKGGRIVAELTERGPTWIVALPGDEDPALMLPLISMVYRENTIGG